MASSIGTTVGSMFKPINCPIPEYALCDLAMGFCVRELMSYVHPCGPHMKRRRLVADCLANSMFLAV